MNNSILSRLKNAEEQLQLQIPESVVEIIVNLKTAEISFGKENWQFGVLNDNTDNETENFIIRTSINFQKKWNLKALVLAENVKGNYLLLLPEKDTNLLMPTIYICVEEMAEIKVIADSLSFLAILGPKDYHNSNEFYLKKENGHLLEWNEFYRAQLEEQQALEQISRNNIDDWINDERTDLITEIITGLENLTESRDKHHAHWALNKLSNIYLKGFGAVPPNIQTAFFYSDKAMAQGSHKAFSNRASCYLRGFGVEKNLAKALELINEANRLSRLSVSAYLFEKGEDGLYDSLKERILHEMAISN